MRHLKWTFAWAIVFLVGHMAQAAIFGPDDRSTITPKSPAYLLARSTAVAVLSSNISMNPKGLLDLQTDSLSDQFCRDEKFASDPSLSYACTGFLVAPDILVTAGHCMVNVGQSRKQTASYCEAFSWLFDYQVQENGQVQLTDIAPDQLYACQQILYAIREETPPFRDFAVVQLKRPVTDRAYFATSRAPLAENENLTMIGYPLGMPAKFSSEGRVILNSTERQSFVTNLDALDGNSGSPVFNSRNEVVGILVGGTPVELFKKDPIAGCFRYNTCDDDGKNCAVPDGDTSKIAEFQTTGSIVQRIGPVMEVLNQVQFLSAFSLSDFIRSGPPRYSSIGHEISFQGRYQSGR